MTRRPVTRPEPCAHKRAVAVVRSAGRCSSAGEARRLAAYRRRISFALRTGTARLLLILFRLPFVAYAEDRGATALPP